MYFINNKNKAFTLLEVILVIAIIAVLAGLIIFLIRPSEVLTDTKNSRREADTFSIQEGLNAYISREAEIPSSIAQLETGRYDICRYGAENENCTATSVSLDLLVDTKYLKKIPVNPDCTSMTDSCYDLYYDSNFNEFEIIANEDESSFTFEPQTYAGTYIFGGNDSEFNATVKTDNQNNVYLFGDFNRTMDVDPGSGTVNLTAGGGPSSGYGDAFIVKLDSSGEYVASYQVGGSAATSDSIDDLFIDDDGNLYFTGSTYDGTIDADPTSGVSNLSTGMAIWGFVTKINSDGTWAFTKPINGNNYTQGNAIYVDASGKILVAGMFTGTADFDSGAGTVNRTSNGQWDNFLLVLNSDGTYNQVHTFGGSLHNGIDTIALDSDENIYLTGVFEGSTDFNFGAGSDILTTQTSDFDAYLMKINNDYSYDRTYRIGGQYEDYITDLKIDSDGNIHYLGMFTYNTDLDPTSGVDSRNPVGSGENLFLTKLNSDMSYNQTSTWNIDTPNGFHKLFIDERNNLFLTGPFSDTQDFDPGEEVAEFSHTGPSYYSDGFILFLDKNHTYRDTYIISSDQNEEPKSIAVSGNGSLYISGSFATAPGNYSDFDPTETEDLKQSQGAPSDLFLSIYR